MGVHVQLGQILDKGHKKTKKKKGKAENCACPLQVIPPKGWANH